MMPAIFKRIEPEITEGMINRMDHNKILADISYSMHIFLMLARKT